jgi:hypothetical protein
MDDFKRAVAETFKVFGKPPLIGTFAPTLGDIGTDPENIFWAWDGKRWISSDGKLAKTFEQWMNFS